MTELALAQRRQQRTTHEWDLAESCCKSPLSIACAEYLENATKQDKSSGGWTAGPTSPRRQTPRQYKHSSQPKHARGDSTKVQHEIHNACSAPFGRQITLHPTHTPTCNSSSPSSTELSHRFVDPQQNAMIQLARGGSCFSRVREAPNGWEREGGMCSLLPAIMHTNSLGARAVRNGSRPVLLEEVHLRRLDSLLHLPRLWLCRIREEKKPPQAVHHEQRTPQGKGYRNRIAITIVDVAVISCSSDRSSPTESCCRASL